MAQLTERRRIAQLLRRAGFGGSPGEIDAHAQMGFDAAVDRLVDFERVPNDELEARVAAMESELDLTRLPASQAIWLYRMLHTARPLEEKMTLFWHDHFATANYKVGRPAAMYAQNAFFRANALGSFREILAGISRDPAMLRWLDGNANRKGKPNENYARELLELFTMGVGNYSEEDVRAAARAFTGWFFDRSLSFVFNPNQHDFGEKAFLGRVGPWDGDDVIGIILDQPATARYMATKLFTFFVHDHPAPDTVERLAEVLRRNGYSVRELVRTIFRSPEFSSPEAYHALVRSPVELLIGTMKLLGVDEYARSTPAVLGRMGMVLFNPPNVAGWDWGAAWISSATLLERLNAASDLTAQRGENAGLGMDPTAWLQRVEARTPAQIVDGLLDLLVDGDAPTATRNGLLAYLNDGFSGPPESFIDDERRVDRAVRGVAHLIMCTPVYQMS